MIITKTDGAQKGRIPLFLKAVVQLKPPYLAIGGLAVTLINMMIGNLLLVHVSPGLSHSCFMAVLIASTVSVPPFSLAVLLLHYRSSATSLRSIVALYLSLVVICANINLDMMIHLGHRGPLPFHGMSSMWDVSAAAGMSLNWPNFFLVVADCLHFSIETLLTVGYGDIVPVTWYAKMAVDIQVLMGLGITVLAVGTHFSTRKTTTDAVFCPHCGDPLDTSAHHALEQSQLERHRNQSRG